MLSLCLKIWKRLVKHQFWNPKLKHGSARFNTTSALLQLCNPMFLLCCGSFSQTPKTPQMTTTTKTEKVVMKMLCLSFFHSQWRLFKKSLSYDMLGSTALTARTLQIGCFSILFVLSSFLLLSSFGQTATAQQTTSIIIISNNNPSRNNTDGQIDNNRQNSQSYFACDVLLASAPSRQPSYKPTHTQTTTPKIRSLSLNSQTRPVFLACQWEPFSRSALSRIAATTVLKKRFVKWDFQDLQKSAWLKRQNLFLPAFKAI